MNAAAGKHWYAVEAQARAETLALEQLQRQDFEAYLPRYMKRRLHARKTTWLAAPLFPGYLFVRLDIDAERWRAVHSTRGAKRLVCNGENPAPIPDSIIEEIMSREDRDGMVALEAGTPFRRGQAVQIEGGAMADRIGLFDGVADAKRVFILLELLGRQVRVRVPLQTLGARA